MRVVDAALNIKGLFRDREELSRVIALRKVCYDTEPYYITSRTGALIQIGFQLNLFGTFDTPAREEMPDSAEYRKTEQDVRRIAEALSNTCSPMHMGESAIVESGALVFSADRGMRPDVTVHVPVFDQEHFGHPVDAQVEQTLREAERLLLAAGVQKKRWRD